MASAGKDIQTLSETGAMVLLEGSLGGMWVGGYITVRGENVCDRLESNTLLSTWRRPCQNFMIIADYVEFLTHYIVI